LPLLYRIFYILFDSATGRIKITIISRDLNFHPYGMGEHTQTDNGIRSTLFFRLLRSTIGNRARMVAAAKIWNALPHRVASASSIDLFWQQLKTFLFQRSFCCAHFSGPCHDY